MQVWMCALAGEREKERALSCSCVHLMSVPGSRMHRRSACSWLFAVCFCRLSDPRGPGLDTNDSPLSLMPPVLEHSTQERAGPGH